MEVLAAAAMASLAAGLWRRWRVVDGVGNGAETLVLCGAGWLATLGMIATLVALAGRFDIPTMTVASSLAAICIWPWRKRAPSRRPSPVRPSSLRHLKVTGVGLLIVVGGLALRRPPNDYALAGRDQGTYTLRARHVLRTGSLAGHDVLLEQAAAQTDRRSGPADIVGLYPIESTRWRQDIYEGAYRPGWYLADRERGTVVAQFLHLHPMLMACAAMVGGTTAIGWLVTLQAGLTLLAIWCVGRRLWPTGPWPALPVTLLSVSPIAIWVHRTALSEVPASMFLCAGVLALLRARQDRRALDVAAFSFAAIAWVRGNGFLWAPLLLLCLWLSPPGDGQRRRPMLVYVVVLSASILVHAASSFPYLHDEVVRQLPWPGEPSPWQLVWMYGVGLVAWLSVDELWLQHGSAGPRRARLRRVLPWLLCAAVLAGIASWLWNAHVSPGRPYARLDPAAALLGVPLIALGLGGAAVAARRFDADGPAAAWWLGLGSLLAMTVVLYGRRNLPQLGLYYYGRYLVPEVLVALCLSATALLWILHRRLCARATSRWHRLGAHGAIAAAAGWLLASTGAVLIEHPTSRMREFAGADRIVEALADRIPADGIVIAGGEGWHHGHTFNQIAGALQQAHGTHVVPYRSREAAYATAYELLVTGPRARGEPAPPVFLLINEATHHARLDPNAAPVAAVDDLLPPPFVAQEIWGAELFVHRLTPVTDAVPTRVTRDELRLALIRITHDPEGPDERVLAVHPPAPGLTVQGGAGIVGEIRCLSAQTPLRIELDPALSGPHGVVLVAAPGSASLNPRWQVSIDGAPRALSMPRARARARDTIGPLWVRDGPVRIEVLGAQQRSHGSACPHGGLHSLRILGPPAAAIGSVRTSATTFVPPKDLGHPPEPTRWVSGRGLGRYRPGPDPSDVAGMSLQLTPASPLEFAPEPMPSAGGGTLQVIVTLTGTSVPPSSRLRLWAGDELVAEIDPPDERAGSWQSSPISWKPSGPIAALALELVHADADARVWVRDIGLFSHGPQVVSTVAGDSDG